MKNKIKEYLGDGLKPSMVASIVGCTPAYISQLLKDEDFLSEVRTLQVANVKPPDEKLEAKYESLEQELLSRIYTEIGSAELRDLTKTLETVVKARDMRYTRKHPVQAAPTEAGRIVNINLPMHLLAYNPSVTLNEQREIVAIDNKNLAPLSSDGVKRLFQQKQAVATQITVEI